MPKEPKVDLKVLDEAILKVLAYKPKRKSKASPSDKKEVVHGRANGRMLVRVRARHSEVLGSRP